MTENSLNLRLAASDCIISLTPENSFTDYPDIVTVPQVMKMLCIGRNTVYKLLNEGDLKFVRIGCKYKIPKVSVMEFINRKNMNNS